MYLKVTRIILLSPAFTKLYIEVTNSLRATVGGESKEVE